MRPSWEDYALTLARAAATRSEDPWVKVGAVVLRKDHTVAATGYNGAPPACVINWSNREARRQLVIHAEQNALRYTTPADIAGGLLAVTHRPCTSCMPTIAAYGIVHIVYSEELDAETYPQDEAIDMAMTFGLVVTRRRTA